MGVLHSEAIDAELVGGPKGDEQVKLGTFTAPPALKFNIKGKVSGSAIAVYERDKVVSRRYYNEETGKPQGYTKLWLYRYKGLILE